MRRWKSLELIKINDWPEKLFNEMKQKQQAENLKNSSSKNHKKL